MAKLSLNALRSFLSGGDEDLMLRVKQQDDTRAFASLVSRWEGPISNLCARMTGDLHRGEDLKQETFARLFAKRAAYTPSGRFSTYLWRIALNICHDELRRVNRRQQLLPITPTQDDDDASWEEHALDAPTPGEQVARAEEGEIVREALLQLPEIYRTVLVLRHYQQLKLSEIAETLEIPLGTVNSRMAEALSRLSRILEPHLSEAPAARPPRRQESLVI
jgi:RNA polymerase sigma-70 factor (ECF subfamily)